MRKETETKAAAIERAVMDEPFTKVPGDCAAAFQDVREALEKIEHHLVGLLARHERVWHRMGELWERCQGKSWPDAESAEFARLRDEVAPTIRKQLIAAAPKQAEAVPQIRREELHKAVRELGFTTNGQTSDLIDLFEAHIAAAPQQKRGA